MTEPVRLLVPIKGVDAAGGTIMIYQPTPRADFYAEIDYMASAKRTRNMASGNNSVVLRTVMTERVRQVNAGDRIQLSARMIGEAGDRAYKVVSAVPYYKNHQEFVEITADYVP